MLPVIKCQEEQEVKANLTTSCLFEKGEKEQEVKGNVPTSCLFVKEVVQPG